MRHRRWPCFSLRWAHKGKRGVNLRGVWTVRLSTGTKRWRAWMRRAARVLAVVAGILAAGGVAGRAQAAAQSAAPATATDTPAAASAGCCDADPAAAQLPAARLHGVVKSGNIPLPGVTVTAQNTLTGKKYSTTTDITGAWSMRIPQNGRYVIRTEFAAFAVGIAGSAVERHKQRPGGELRADAGIARGGGAGSRREQRPASRRRGSTVQQLAGNGAESLSLTSALSADTDTEQRDGGHKRGRVAVGGEQLRLRQRFGGHQRAVGTGEPDGGHESRPDPRRDSRLPGSQSGAGASWGGRPLRRTRRRWWIWRRRVWRWRVWWWRFRRSWWWWRWIRRTWRRWRRARQLPRLQSRAAAWSDLLDGQQLGAECGAVCAVGPAADSAGVGYQSLRAYVHERAVSAQADQAERQRYGLPYAFGLAQFQSRRSITRRCRRLRSGAGTSARRGCRPSTIRRRSSSSLQRHAECDSAGADRFAGDGAAELFSAAECDREAD